MTLPELLRKETHAHHQSLEQSALLRQLTSDNLTLGVYLQVLYKFHAYFSALEQLIELQKEGIAAYLPDLHERRKANLLAQDFYVLQGNKLSFNPEISKTLLPEISSVSQAFGCLYVMEGSTLGGTLIAKHVQKKLGLSVNNSLCFFSGYGKSTGEKWTEFKRALINFSENNNDKESMVVEAANQTFSGFSTWLSS